MALQTTMDKLIGMRLSMMARAYADQDTMAGVHEMTFEERFAQLVDAEWDSRRTNKRARLLRQATLSCPEARVGDIKWYADRRLDRAFVMELSNCTWVTDRKNLVITGATGSGKTWMACALAAAACESFRTVKYIRLPELMDELAVARDEEWLKAKRRYVKYDLLVIDDFMLEPLGGREARELLELVESRYKRGSMILCSQYGPSGWHERITEGALADAVIDRLIYNSRSMHIEGESMRKRLAQEAEGAGADAV